uniref:Zinc finger GRF-type domain-containing protein n=1 Tax=Brassica oleracea var. oleracea TaxID=109376 RepID=A0A0D3E1Q2_BRAOL
MGQDYSYSQPSSSEVSLTWLLQEEADVYADEAQSRLNLQVPVQYVPQPDVEEGIPKTCYCGGDPVVATSYTPRDPGRRYFTCQNVDDDDCHIIILFLRTSDWITLLDGEYYVSHFMVDAGELKMYIGIVTDRAWQKNQDPKNRTEPDSKK